MAFDPCLDVPDATLDKAGYDPSTTNPQDVPSGGDYTFLGCGFKTPVRQYTLTLLSGNVTFAEEVAKTSAYAEPIQINGRSGLLKLEEDVPDSCAISLETNYGILILLRSQNHNYIGRAPQEEWCAGLEDTARQIEPLLPKG